MKRKCYLVVVEDDPSPAYAGRVRISLYETIEPDELGKPCGAFTEQTKRGVPYAAKSLFAAQYGNACPPSSDGVVCESQYTSNLAWLPTEKWDTDQEVPGA